MNTSVNLGNIHFKNPIMPASGTFGIGREFNELYDIQTLGAIVTKGVGYTPWEGNPTPRIAETHSGMLNSIGLQNKGVQHFVKEEYPFLAGLKTNVIVNICGKTMDEYCQVAEVLNDIDIQFIEVNISCPNVHEGGMLLGQSPHLVEQITKRIKKCAKHPVIVKLSPNVVDITELAIAAQEGGADGLSLINTVMGTSIDIDKQAFVLYQKFGGLSGPAIKPIGLRMVYLVAKAVKIPIIGIGGIMCAEDAIEYMMAGATAVGVGTANFNNPYVMPEIIKGVGEFLVKHNIEDIRDIIGCLH